MTAVATVHRDPRGRVSVTPIAPVVCRGLSRSRSIQHGDVCIAGTRIPVRSVFERVCAGESIPSIAKDYAVSLASVRQCIALMSASRESYQSAERVFDRWATTGGKR